MKISKEKILNNKFTQSIARLAKKNVVINGFITILVWLVAFLPVWLYLGAKALIVPVGFWQQLALFCIFAIILGWIQILFVFLGFIFTLFLWTEFKGA